MPLKRVPINRQSAKRKKAYAGKDGRRAFVKRVLAERPVCQMCKVNRSVDVHEKISRSAIGAIVPGEKADLQGQVFFVLCREDHDFIHLNPKWAKEEGFLV